MRQIIPNGSETNELQTVLQKRLRQINKNSDVSPEVPHSAGHKVLRPHKSLAASRRRGSKQQLQSNLLLIRQQFENMGGQSKSSTAPESMRNHASKLNATVVCKPAVTTRGRKPTLKPRPAPKKPARLHTKEEISTGTSNTIPCKANKNISVEKAAIKDEIPDENKESLVVSKESDSDDYEDVGNWEDADKKKTVSGIVGKLCCIWFCIQFNFFIMNYQHHLLHVLIKF